LAGRALDFDFAETAISSRNESHASELHELPGLRRPGYGALVQWRYFSLESGLREIMRERRFLRPIVPPLSIGLPGERPARFRQKNRITAKFPPARSADHQA
jgi:hypothetical protein